MHDLKAVRMQTILRVAHHLHTQWPALVAHEPDLRFGSLQTLVRAAPSDLHGVGLFAAEPLAAGTVVTLYPIHALGDASTCLTCDVDGEDAKHFGSGGSDWPYRVDLPVSPRLAEWAEDLWIDANPARDVNAGWLGHLVNEGVVCPGGAEEQIVSYYASTLERANCLMVPFGDTPLMCWVTTSDVSQGDELLGVYGHDYWVARTLGAVPPYTPPVLQAAREWKEAIQASRRGVQTAYADEVGALGALFEHADADAQDMARGEKGPRAGRRQRQRRQQRVQRTASGRKREAARAAGGAGETQ
jgi:hypothetical protein